MPVSTKEREQIERIFSGPCSQKMVCPVKDILATYGDKWTMYTVLLLGQHQTLRFSELRGSISGISQRMLTVTLRTLEEDGMVNRTQFTQIPPRVEYSLTPLGESLLKQLLQMASWAADHFDEVLKARTAYRKRQTV